MKKRNFIWTLAVLLTFILLAVNTPEVDASYDYDWTCQERPGLIVCYPDNITDYEQKFEVTANQGSTWGPSSGMPDGEYFFWFWGVSGDRSFSVDRPNGTHQEASKVIPMTTARYPKRDTNEPAQSNPWLFKTEVNGKYLCPWRLDVSGQGASLNLSDCVLMNDYDKNWGITTNDGYWYFSLDASRQKVDTYQYDYEGGQFLTWFLNQAIQTDGAMPWQTGGSGGAYTEGNTTNSFTTSTCTYNGVDFGGLPGPVMVDDVNRPYKRSGNCLCYTRYCRYD